MKDLDNDSSDWNMGVSFYETLSRLKNLHMAYFIEGDFVRAIELLSNEIDWVGEDIGSEDLKSLRRDVDNVSEFQKRGLNKEIIKKKIRDIRRKLWDSEQKHNITRPKNNIDMSNVPVSVINNR